jgi:hypothetical protein
MIMISIQLIDCGENLMALIYVFMIHATKQLTNGNKKNHPVNGDQFAPNNGVRNFNINMDFVQNILDIADHALIQPVKILREKKGDAFKDSYSVKYMQNTINKIPIHS